MADEPESGFAHFSRWRHYWKEPAKEVDDPEARYHRPGWFKRVLLLFLPGRVSRIHLYEAQERYLTLWSTLEYYAKLPCNDPAKKTERDSVISMCQKTLKRASVLLTRRQNDLNMLWREMTRVHIGVIERVIPENQLPGQLDFCREEAYRVVAKKDSEINEMIQRLAEVMDESKKNITQKVRLLRALIERFTTIRTGRMHQQFVNIRTYQIALLILAPISILMIANVNLLLPRASGSASSSPSLELGEPTSEGAAIGSEVPTVGEIRSPVQPEAQSSWLFWGALSTLYEQTNELLATNIIAFVFFAGLAGGFFSVVIRLRNQDLVPGEDAYFIWYVLSKPFIGALGAAILFVLVQADFVTFEIVRELMDDLKKNQPGPVIFGFGFLSGFTERLVFPEFR